MQNANCTDGKCSAPTNGGCAPQNTSCSSQNTSCSKKECCSPESLMCEMVSLAKCAKKELLREKMKMSLETKMGKKLDKIADLATDSLIGMCQAKMDCADKKMAAVEKLTTLLKS